MGAWSTTDLCPHSSIVCFPTNARVVLLSLCPAVYSSVTSFPAKTATAVFLKIVALQQKMTCSVSAVPEYLLSMDTDLHRIVCHKPVRTLQKESLQLGRYLFIMLEKISCPFL
ncbi:hypothetical protein FQA47_000991 [Oryzias melastigma]|uniref:Uncharacterized protein n=1 Tax=Oryzias melastigma TaxID=30732 RepID=A0A834FP63_ORYME|nr:hypothetical protein FQA47_000991 [Oryzias melastigma]